MPNTIGGFLTNLFEKGKAHASLQMRKSAAEKAAKEVERLAYQTYSGLYLGTTVQAPMMEVLNQLQNYVKFTMYGWELMAGNMAADGTSAGYQYVLNFTETFVLGTWGCPLKPLTLAARVKVNLMTNQNMTEHVTVPYRLIFAVGLQQSRGGVTVDSSLNELIDPGNSVAYVRSGNFEAPSMLYTRGGGVNSEGLLQHLHANCKENRPGYQEWFDSEGRYFPSIKAALEKLHKAQESVGEAQDSLKRLQ